jgi:hypothetical protein
VFLQASSGLQLSVTDSTSLLTDIVVSNGLQVPTFTCPGDHEVAIINTIGVVLSVVSDFVSTALRQGILISVLALPIFRVLKLKINTRQKWALIGVFAVGTIVAAIEVIRGAFILASGSTLDSIPLNLIWITLQCTLGIFVTNLPILRPLIFTRSFGDSTDEGTRRDRWTQRSQHAKAIPLYEVPEYLGRTMVSAGGDVAKGDPRYDNDILKSVEVRVESASVGSSIESRNNSKTFMPV